MVTDSERDYLWETYAADRRARLNLGIRRRLAPLLEHDRRRIELMNSLLLSMPGTPVIYYGDEIGMGDNIHLGDRDGVRTPMQWSPDRNGGFSRADPAALVLPPIMDPLYGYERGQRRSADAAIPHSLLNWMRRMLAVRRPPSAPSAAARCVSVPEEPQDSRLSARISRTRRCCASPTVAHSPQAVELDLSEFAGRVPVELNGGAVVSADRPTDLSADFAALRLLLVRVSATASDWPAWHTPAPEPMPEFVTIVCAAVWRRRFARPRATLIESETLPPYIAKRRWFGLRTRRSNRRASPV